MRKNNAALKLTFIIFVLILSIAIKVSAQDSVAPNFTLTDIDGNEFSLSDYRGTVVLLNFFATWCPGCRNEIELVLKALHRYFGERLVMISVSVDPGRDTVELLQKFREKYEISWKIARDTTDVSKKYNVTGLPRNIIIDQDGYIRYQHEWVESSVLRKEVEELLSAEIKPPVASFTHSPNNPVVGETVTFDASASHDPDGTIVSYEWDFGDGATGTGVTTTHAYAAATTYTITLTVTDNDNTSANTTAKVTVLPSTVPVHDVAITSVMASKATVTVGRSISITVVTKNEGTQTETFEVTIYYGMTTIETQTVTNLSPGTSKTLTSNWNTAEVSPGTYTIKAVASTIPKENDTADNTFIDGKVTVQEAPPPPPPTASDNFTYAAAGTAIIVVAAIAVYLLRVRKHKPV